MVTRDSGDSTGHSVSWSSVPRVPVVLHTVVGVTSFGYPFVGLQEGLPPFQSASPNRKVQGVSRTPRKCGRTDERTRGSCCDTSSNRTRPRPGRTPLPGTGTVRSERPGPTSSWDSYSVSLDSPSTVSSRGVVTSPRKVPEG